MTFDATSGQPDRPLGELLRDLQAEDSRRGIDAALDRVDDLLADWDRRGFGGLDEDIVADLVEVTGREDAPLAYRSLKGRVESGMTSWETFWHDPTDVPGGMRLIHDVMRLNAERLQQTLRGLPAIDDGEFRTLVAEAQQRQEQARHERPDQGSGPSRSRP